MGVEDSHGRYGVATGCAHTVDLVGVGGRAFGNAPTHLVESGRDGAHSDVPCSSRRLRSLRRAAPPENYGSSAWSTRMMGRSLPTRGQYGGGVSRCLPGMGAWMCVYSGGRNFRHPTRVTTRPPIHARDMGSCFIHSSTMPPQHMYIHRCGGLPSCLQYILTGLVGCSLWPNS
jgi:hypothetical protein